MKPTMVTTKLETKALDSLCSKDQLDLLNAIDRLRSYGIGDHVSLPQIIVCGDQSSGKSSVLEAISHVSFPIKSNVCTRFPTELVLRRAPISGSSVSIVPHASRSEAEKESLRSFHEELDGFARLANLIEAAKVAMGIHGGKTFSKDLLRIEITGPDRPHLTIVDLPGLIHSETKEQTAADVHLIKDVVKEYMQEPRSVILAVISAKNDLANQIVLNLAREVDPAGTRTLGIITKPDTLNPGSTSEAFYASLARNLEVKFRLGWHVLKNMDTDKGLATVEKRDLEEKRFFSNGIWKDLPSVLLGVTELNGRLSNVLLNQISHELPLVMKEITVKLSHCQDKLRELGRPMTTLHDKKYLLMQMSQVFQTIVKSAIDGTYNHPFFKDPETDDGYNQRVRAVVQYLNRKFANEMSECGHYRHITLSSGATTTKSTEGPIDGPIKVSRDDFLPHVENLLQRTRGRELPCTFNPMIVASLFKEQCRPWKAILNRHVQRVFEATKEFIVSICRHISDDITAKQLFSEVVEPALDKLMVSLDEKAQKLLLPHLEGHPITYNQQFFHTFQKSRDDRRKAEVVATLKKSFKITDDDCGSSALCLQPTRNVDFAGLVKQLAKRSEPDMDRFAASEALNCMESYYKVALKRFLDDVAVELVKTELISVLSDIFLPADVFSMSEDKVERITGETEDSKRQRDQLQQQLDVLSKGVEVCKRFIGLRIASGRSLTKDTSPVAEEAFSAQDLSDRKSVGFVLADKK